jgi:hypothetical protein
MNEHVKSKDAEKAKSPPDKSPAAEDHLHEALEDTFPASDPPATTQPGAGRDTETPVKVQHKAGLSSV